MSDLQGAKKLPDTMVSVSYWALDSLLDWAEAVLIHVDELPWRISDEQIEQMREWQAAGESAVFGDVDAAAHPEPTEADIEAAINELEVAIRQHQITRFSGEGGENPHRQAAIARCHAARHRLTDLIAARIEGKVGA